MPIGQRTPGGLDHFERARDAGAVARLEALGGNRITTRKFGMQCFDAVAFQPRAHGLAHLGWNRRHRRKPARQRLKVKTGAADKDRHAILRAHFREHRAASATQAPAEKFNAASTWP